MLALPNVVMQNDDDDDHKMSSTSGRNSTPPSTLFASGGSSGEPRWYFLPVAVVPLWILVGNCLVLLAVIRQRSLRTLSNWVIASLALTDFLLALLVVPLGVYQLVGIPYKHGK